MAALCQKKWHKKHGFLPQERFFVLLFFSHGKQNKKRLKSNVRYLDLTHVDGCGLPEVLVVKPAIYVCTVRVSSAGPPEENNQVCFPMLLLFIYSTVYSSFNGNVKANLFAKGVLKASYLIMQPLIRIDFLRWALSQHWGCGTLLVPRTLFLWASCKYLSLNPLFTYVLYE